MRHDRSEMDSRSRAVIATLAACSAGDDPRDAETRHGQ